MSLKSKPGTAVHASVSNISETTMGQDKRQNRFVIEWLRRVDPQHPFLLVDDKTWSYGEVVAEVERRPASPVVVPSLTPASIFDLLAGLSAGGLIVKPTAGWIGMTTDAPLVVYTSGSSGAPKGVRFTMANLEAAARASAEHLGHDGNDNWLLAMPLHHVGGLSILVRQAFTGGSVTLLPEFEPESFARAMKGRATMVSVVATMLRRIVDLGPFAGVRAVLVGGGPIPDGLLERAAAAGLPVLPTYGLTETFGQIATLRPGSEMSRRAHPLPGVQLRIQTDGRIAVRGDQVSPGYLGEPDRTDPWFVTSDLGELDDEGALHVLGRADTVIITGGENVDPELVEAALRDLDGVDELVVVGVPDEEWGHRVACVYAGEADIADLERDAGRRLAPFMVPKEWLRVDAIPRTSLGKPDRVGATRLLAG